MNFNEYQKIALSTAVYPNKGDNIVYPLLGLAGEVGEIFEKYKKIIRDKDNVISEEDRQAIKLEISDVFWYLAALSYELNLTLEDVIKSNIEKLIDRKRRGKIHGSGDTR